MEITNIFQQAENLLPIFSTLLAIGLGLILARYVLRLAVKVFKFGCGALVLIGAALLLFYGVLPMFGS